jgi:ATP adenylyltransferase
VERMWSPWRSQYIDSFKGKGKKKPKKASLFTEAWKSRDDNRNLIVWRGKHCFVIMNRYPYNSGHIMIVPYRQTRDFVDLTPEELGEMMTTVQRAIEVLNETMGPHGFNFGANLGRVSGAGVDDHIHFHLVPRWNGDTNFMPVLADTKVISEDMRKTLKNLQKAFRKAALED